MNLNRIGILGGTFDPIHEGHVALAKQAVKLAGLDRVLLLPMARASYRDAVTSVAHRMKMCRLAAANESKLSVSPIGTEPSVCYTVDTLPLLRRAYPGCEFSLIIGADKLSMLPHWKSAAQLFSQVDFLCFSRPGIDESAALEKARQAGARITMLSGDPFPFSSTLIRSKIARFEDAEGLNKNVLYYIAQNGLYLPDYETKLKTMINPRRYRHTLGVRTEAVRLAALHGLPLVKSSVAGLLHDCAKGMALKDLQQIAEKNGLVSDPTLMGSNAMLHGPVGAYVARHTFGVEDEDILSAIRSHTIGRPNMTLFELCIFVADGTEAGREEYEGLSRIRQLSDLSLPAAALESLYRTKQYLESEHRPFYPIAQQTVSYLQQIVQNNIQL